MGKKVHPPPWAGGENTTALTPAQGFFARRENFQETAPGFSRNFTLLKQCLREGIAVGGEFAQVVERDFPDFRIRILKRGLASAPIRKTIQQTARGRRIGSG
jgi:hypothetical protein